MEIYKYCGVKTISFNSSTNTGQIDSTIPENIPTLVRFSKMFEIKNIGVHANVRQFVESPLSFAKSTDTLLEKWDRDRELIKNFQSIAIEFSVDNAILFRTFVTGSTVPYDFYLDRNVYLNQSQALNVNLVDMGHGLLFNQDKITLHCSYETTIMGVN